MPSDQRSSAVELASSHLITTCATFAAIATFVGIGSEIVPGSLGIDSSALVDHAGLVTAFILNIAVIIFGWRRSRDLGVALAANAEAERRAHENAYSDHVTGLANRRKLVRSLEALLENGRPQGVLILLDLDHFKKVNDLYGHAAGDALLAFVGETLLAQVPANACCARLGGDEFAVLMPGQFEAEAVDVIAGAIVARLALPVHLGGIVAHISASLGISALEGQIGTAESALRRSDIAMYEAKRLGRNGFVWFDREMEQQLELRNALEEEMRAGIVAGEFVPFYQPQISLTTSELKGFEVLARWNNPRRGTLEPTDFIPIAEASGLISALSIEVMRRAFIEARAWPADLMVAVNISPLQFKDPDLAPRILQLLTETGFPARRLELEITESALLEARDLAVAAVESLKNSGVSISLDDFGTGYASLTQLKSLPFDRIKIDRSFVTALLTDDQSSAIVSTIAGLGQSLKLPITAEGVESEGVRARLEALGCSDGQGWLFGQAIPGERVQQLLAEHGVGSAAVNQLGAELGKGRSAA
jgi:diguanylate cyclase (GGDEF)-like protein